MRTATKIILTAAAITGPMRPAAATVTDSEVSASVTACYADREELKAEVEQLKADLKTYEQVQVPNEPDAEVEPAPVVTGQ